MQTGNVAPDNSEETTTPLPPNPAPTQESVTQVPSTAPLTSTTTALAIEPDLLVIANELATTVRECQVASLMWTIEAGERLRAYRDSLQADDWAQVLRSNRLPLGTRMAQMLVRIARNKAIHNSKRTQQLPDSITILNLLAGLPISVLEQALDAGLIHPNTTLKEAEQFVLQQSCNSSLPTLSEPPACQT